MLKCWVQEAGLVTLHALSFRALLEMRCLLDMWIALGQFYDFKVD